MVDIHSHILPGVDDGASTWAIAIDMMAAAAKDGIRHIVATPHSNAQFRYDRSAHAERMVELKRRAGVPIDLSLGCDFHFSLENMQIEPQDWKQFWIGSGPYLLIEFSDFGIPPNVNVTMRALIRRGIVPIITHPERNLFLRSKLEMLYSMVEVGCLIQVTANSITGFWGKTARRACLGLLTRGLVSAVATDAHDLRHRPPIMSAAREAIRHKFGKDIADALCSTIPSAIVEGKPIPDIPSLARRRETLAG
ncbi:MAG TPA: CpsB/CapC family capsule biosynthesis tyrosine phosphatase [Candidatus Bathyarchaeia archaeon]|jgi:protein-tyrosine phosphatase|nr:CpsB/CapC family capsule biosynthesis tyrosine phosphatase [Candidatus Bathyarchaeia archaeon]